MAATDPRALAERFGALYTGVLVDVLDRRGRMQQTLPSELLPLREGMRLAGPAFPVEGRPEPGIGYDESVRLILEMLGAVPEHHVVVTQSNDTQAAHLGELSVTSLQVRGCAGAVIEGGCRDVEYILRSGFPVFARYRTPRDGPPRWRLVAYDVPVTIGGVRIEPRDYLVGDRDGIVAIPRDLRDAVLEEAEAKMATESEIRDAVVAGALPLDAYERFGTF